MYSWNASPTLKALVKALCGDFERRRRCIESESVSRRVMMEYVFINSKISDAASEICGEELAQIFIKEIGESVGYAKSEAYAIGEAAYKRYKVDVMKNVAKKLHLSDF